MYWSKELLSVEKFELLQGISKINGAKWQVLKPKASVCIIHGLGEHSARYDTVARFLNQMGFSVYSMDILGHGKSDGARGHIGNNMAVMFTIDKLVTYAQNANKNCPVFMYGHSLGGNLALTYRLFMGMDKVSGYVLTSPWLETKYTMSTAKIALMKTVSLVYPQKSFDISAEIKKDRKVSVKDIAEDYIKDDLIHPFMSVGTFISGRKRGKIITKNAKIKAAPVMIIQGSEDNICKKSTTEKFAKDSDSIYIEIEGAGHELIHRREFYEILERINSFYSDLI